MNRRVASTTLFFDPYCGVCNWIAVKIRDRGKGGIAVLGLDSAAADEQLGNLAPADRWASWHVIFDGNRHSGGGAVSPLLRALGAPAWMRRIVDSHPKAVSAGYTFVARRRALIGRVVSRRAVARAREELGTTDAGRRSG